MPKPKVILGEQVRAEMLRGFELMAQVVALTLGPVGRTVTNATSEGKPQLLHDAATISRRIIQLPDRAEDAGAQIMRHIVWSVREDVGDGSATTAVLALSIAREMQRLLVAGANAMIVKRGLIKATKVAIRALDEMSIPLEGQERIAAAAAAAVGEPEIGKILGEIYDVLGLHANIVIQPYVATFHDRAYQKGARFKGSYVSPYLITDEIRKLVVLDDVFILVADRVFSSAEETQKALQVALKAGVKNFLIVCKRMDLKFLLGNVFGLKDPFIVCIQKSFNFTFFKFC